MSDPMMGGRPPMPPSGGMSGMPGGGMPGMPGKTSMLNPMDVAGKAATGGLNKNMTVGQFLQQNFGISPNDPIEKFIQVMRQQTQNATTQGKLGVSPQGGRPPMGGGQPMGARPPMGRGMGGGTPMPPSGGQPSLEGLMNKL